MNKLTVMAITPIALSIIPENSISRQRDDRSEHLRVFDFVNCGGFPDCCSGVLTVYRKCIELLTNLFSQSLS